MGETPKPEYVDPFGAPEHLITGFEYEGMAAPDIVRVAYWTSDPSGNVLKVRLLWPTALLKAARGKTEMFFQCMRSTSERAPLLM